jgi:hypothetical protein
MRPIVLPRTGQAPLRFRGELLAETTAGGVTVSIFHTMPDRMLRQRFVVAYHKRLDNGGARSSVAVCRHRGDVAGVVFMLVADRDLAVRLLADADLPDPWSGDVLDLVAIESARGVRYV